MSEDFSYDCVTLDGDIYYGQGLVSGGAPPKIQKLIEKASFLKDINLSKVELDWKLNQDIEDIKILSHQI